MCWNLTHFSAQIIYLNLNILNSVQSQLTASKVRKEKRNFCSRPPEDDVTVSRDVLPAVDDAGPLGSRPDAEHGAAAVGEGLEVPLLRLEHVVDAVGAHGHHHLGAGLRGNEGRDENVAATVKRLRACV